MGSLSIEQINELQGKNAQLQCENEKLREAYNDILASCKNEQQKNEQLNKVILELENKLQLRMASDKESDAFWDEIFSEEDYPFNKENVYKELKDYYFVLEQLPKIYMEITGGTLSKTTYFASSVIEAYNDSLDGYYSKIDDLEYNNDIYKSTIENIKEVAKRYRNCDGTSCDGMDAILNEINKGLNNEMDHNRL